MKGQLQVILTQGPCQLLSTFPILIEHFLLLRFSAKRIVQYHTHYIFIHIIHIYNIHKFEDLKKVLIN